MDKEKLKKPVTIAGTFILVGRISLIWSTKKFY